MDRSGLRSDRRPMLLVGLAAIVLTLSWAGTAAVNSTPPGKGHIERQCIVRAVVSKGVAGHGCNVYGTAKWVNGTTRGTPEWARNALRNCAIGSLVGVAEVYAGGPEAIPVWMAVDCVEHVAADAILTGGR